MFFSFKTQGKLHSQRRRDDEVKSTLVLLNAPASEPHRQITSPPGITASTTIFCSFGTSTFSLQIKCIFQLVCQNTLCHDGCR